MKKKQSKMTSFGRYKFVCMACFKLIQYPQHMYIWYEETNTIHTIYVNQDVW